VVGRNHDAMPRDRPGALRPLGRSLLRRRDPRGVWSVRSSPGRSWPRPRSTTAGRSPPRRSRAPEAARGAAHAAAGTI